MSNDYFIKLKDPRWQKLRLEVMQYNGFSCEICIDKESPLNVHHKEYFKDHEPWEYSIEQLSCLCESCHESQHNRFNFLRWSCSYLNLDGSSNRDDASILLAGFAELDYDGVLCFTRSKNTKLNKELYKLGLKASSIVRKNLGK